MSESAGIVHRLKQILGKFMQDVGILIWGTTEKKEQGKYRALLVDPDGKLVLGDISISNFPSDYPDAAGLAKLGAILQKLSGTLTYTDADITKHVYTKDANGYITSIDFYAGAAKKFTLTITRTVTTITIERS